MKQGHQVMGPPSTSDGGAALLAWLRHMRDEHPVWRDPRGAYHVFRYADVRHVISDFETFSSDYSRFMPAGDAFTRGNLATMDPPRHAHLRRLVNKAFTPRIVSGLAAGITHTARELIRDLPGDQFDLVECFARPLPVIVIADLIGVPATDRQLFHTWVDGLMALQVGELDHADVGTAVQDALGELHGYMTAHCRDRRAAPRDDFISQLLGAEIDGRGVGDEEAAMLCTLLLIAGHVTTTMLLGNAVLCLAENHDAAAEMRSSPATIPGAIEEVLRCRPSFMQTGRFATRETRIGDVTVPAGAYVSSWLLSANHDESQFTEPGRFDIHRNPNWHLAFGHGIHFCLGAPLARLEARISLELLSGHFAWLGPVPADQIVFYADNTTFGAKRLPVVAARTCQNGGV